LIASGLKIWRGRFGLESPPSTGFREGLQWLMLARLGMLYLALCVLVIQQVFRHDAAFGPTLMAGYALLSVSFAFNLFHAYFLQRIPERPWVAGLSIVFDACITSSWIYFTGGRESLFGLWYLVQILAVSLIFYQKGAWFAAAVSCLCFGAVNLLHPQPVGWITWSAYSLLFLTLGLVGGYLSEELLRTHATLQERDRSIEKLTALQSRIIAHMPTGLLTVDREMKINFMNPVAAQILSVEAPQTVGKKLSEVEPGLLPFFTQIDSQDVTPDSDEPLPKEGDAALSATGSQHHRSYFVHARSQNARLQQRVEIGRGHGLKILRGDVAELDADAGLGGLLGKQATGGQVLLFQDVTKLLNLEEKVRQNEKLAAVGQLAAGIAHEIRNPLASMSASIEMLKGSLPADPAQSENQRLMDIAIREIDRLNRLITEFLDFVKPEKFRFEKVNLGTLLGDLVLTAKNLKDRKATVLIQENYETNTFALANPEKLKQVVWNLVVNALQAMQRGGKIEIGCGMINDQRVKFWVEDEGQGMDDEVLGHLYEPFFTTKDKGTGLGLATAYKIVEAHHGEIRVTSAPNVGTRFEVVLQAA